MAVAHKSPLYLHDLEGILEYLEERSIRAAEELAAELDRTCQLLAAQPGLGRPRNELCPGARSVVVGKYVLIYSPASDGINALRVIHGSRDIVAAFAESDPD